MKRLAATLLCAAACVGQIAACAFAGPEADATNGTEYGQGGYTNDGGGGQNTLVGGGGGGAPQPLIYTAACGPGCLPATGQAASCDAAAGAGGSATGGGMTAGGAGGAADDCKLGVNVDGDAEGVCSASGSQAAGDICLSSTDCQPGFGCVNSACRAYCCGDLEACPAQTYCALQPMTEMGLEPSSAPEIPVCLPATNCELLSDTSCPIGQTCTIVRVDGTTSCVAPGEGTLGGACPCAAGYVCSTGTNTCKKLCKVDEPDCPVEAPFCQGGATTYPTGFGVCIAT